MYYNFFKAPAVIRTGERILGSLDGLLRSAHLVFPKKILVTQERLWEMYKRELGANDFEEVIFVRGGTVGEADFLTGKIKDRDALAVAFGGGSVLDIVKYCASRSDTPYITVPSTLSNDAVYSCVSRLTSDGKKRSFGVQAPIGIVVDLEVVSKSPRNLLFAGVADIVSNLSALEDWKLAHRNTGEPINEMAYMLSKESVMPLLRYRGGDTVASGGFLLDLTNAIVTSGLAMIVAGNTRASSGAEHLISHAIDEYFPEKSTLHGLQVGWAHLIIERDYRRNIECYDELEGFFDSIGVSEAISESVRFDEADFGGLVPYAMKVRDRYTIFNAVNGTDGLRHPVAERDGGKARHSGVVGTNDKI